MAGVAGVSALGSWPDGYLNCNYVPFALGRDSGYLEAAGGQFTLHEDHDFSGSRPG